MKARLLLISVSLILSCQKDPIKHHLSIRGSEHPKVVVDVPAIATLKFEIPTHAGPDEIRIFLVGRIKDKDGYDLLSYRFDFVKKGKTISQQMADLPSEEDGAEWSLVEDFLYDPNTHFSDKTFFALHFGYPACGYAQHEFVYEVRGEAIVPLDHFVSMGDGPYGFYTKLVPLVKEGRVTGFEGHVVEIGSAENDSTIVHNDDNERLEVTYRDSVSYRFVKGRWRMKRLTPPDKIYRKVNTTYNELYRQHE